MKIMLQPKAAKALPFLVARPGMTLHTSCVFDRLYTSYNLIGRRRNALY